MNKEKIHKKFIKEHKDDFSENGYKYRKNLSKMIIDKELIKKIIEMYPYFTNMEISEKIGIETGQFSVLVIYLRKEGVYLPPKKPNGTREKIRKIVEELKKENYIK